MAKETTINEEKTTSASYIVSFYENVGALTHFYSLYQNLIIELENKYQQVEDLKGLQEEESKILQQVLQEIRYFSHKSIIQYRCISEGINKETNKELLDQYDIIKTTYIIKRNQLDDFVLSLNKVLVNKVMKNLLQNSQDIIESVYKE